MPPLIDLVANDVNDLLSKLDARRVSRFDGREVTLDTKGVSTERAEMTRRQLLLSAIAHPQIAYMLLSLGMLGLVVELWNPGSIAPGVVGGICLLLAFFAFQIIPVNTTGILLIILGIVLLIIEVKVPSFGILGIGGLASLLFGSVMVTSEVPGVTVSYRLILPVVVALGGILFFLGRLAVAAQRLRPVTGAEGLVSKEGRAMTAIAPNRPGQISVHGEIWRATSVESIPAGARVLVNAVDGLTLSVDAINESTRRVGADRGTDQQGDTT
jgi:membrane-bound serine protease (ClpP class)